MAGPGVAAQRLDDDGGVDPDGLRLAAGEEMEVRPGDDDRLCEHRVVNPQQRLLIA